MNKYILHSHISFTLKFHITTDNQIHQTKTPNNKIDNVHSKILHICDLSPGSTAKMQTWVKMWTYTGLCHTSKTICD